MVSVAPLFRPDDSVREILIRHPQLSSVFERHGLLGCGGRAGPEERIDLFAAIHRVGMEGLLAELEAAARAPIDDGEIQPAAEALAATLYRRFLWTALLCTLTFGATFGAYNLLVIQLALGPLPAEHNWLHASFQLFGFVLLFVMGIAYHTLPRFLGTPLRHAAIARASFWLALGGLFLRAYGQFGLLLPGSAPALAAGAALQLTALGCFAGILTTTYLAARPSSALEPFHCFLGAGVLWWLVAGGLLLAEGVVALRTRDSGDARVFHEPLYLAALLGGTLGFIEGMVLRTGPVLLGLRSASRKGVLAAFWLGQLGAALAVFGAALRERGGTPVPFDVGLLAVGASLTAFMIATGVLGARAGHAGDRDRAFPWIIRGAFLWASIFALLAFAEATLELTGRAPPSLLYDGMRHAFALGFVTLMIFGMAGRIVPIFGGSSLRWPGLRSWGAGLIFVGTALREFELLAALGSPWLLHLSACSGLVAATGVSLAGASILATVSAAAKEEATPAEAEAPLPIGPATNVYALVTAYPEALAVLIRHGFTQLASPIARRTLARAVSLRQACGLHGKEVEALVTELRAACSREPRAESAEADQPREAPAGDLLPSTDEAVPVPRELALDALREVIDPELGFNIVDLGLIYGVAISPHGEVSVQLTLTSPHCPHGADLADEAAALLRALPGVASVDVELVFDPPWSPERMAPAVRLGLGLAQFPRSDRKGVTMAENILDIRPIPPPRKHPLIFETFDALPPGGSFVLVNDHNPSPLRYQFEHERPARFSWTCLVEGPTEWRVRIAKS